VEPKNAPSFHLQKHPKFYTVLSSFQSPYILCVCVCTHIFVCVCVCMSHFNIVLLYMLCSASNELSLPVRFPNQTFIRGFSPCVLHDMVISSFMLSPPTVLGKEHKLQGAIQREWGLNDTLWHIFTRLCCLWCACLPKRRHYCFFIT
jgi:hypothetical protein